MMCCFIILGCCNRDDYMPHFHVSEFMSLLVNFVPDEI